VRRSDARRGGDQLVEEASVGAYGESKQRVGLLAMIEQHLACPFETEILGAAVLVEHVDVNDALESSRSVGAAVHENAFPF
jgi:hypothetical protein